MTREEAIELLIHGAWIYSLDTGNKEIEELQGAINIVCSALRGPTREQVEKVWRGEWEEITSPYGKIEGWLHAECGRQSSEKADWCPECGKAMTDKAVDMVMEKLEALHETAE